MVRKGEIMKRCGIIGAGAGLAMFGVFGFLQGALIGGAAGLSVANYVFGENTFALMANEILPRVIVAGSMIAGVVVSCTMFVVFFSVAGVAAGYALAMLQTAPEAGRVYAVETAGKDKG